EAAIGGGRPARRSSRSRYSPDVVAGASHRQRHVRAGGLRRRHLRAAGRHRSRSSQSRRRRPGSTQRPRVSPTGLLVPSQRARVVRSKISSLIAEAAEPFGDLAELARLAERFAHNRVVLLGEATHGTTEFYDARAAITEMLVAKHGFNIVAVEANWQRVRADLAEPLLE